MAVFHQSRLQPSLRQIEHAVGKTVLMTRLAVMGLLRFDENDAAGRAATPGAPAEEILHTLFGDADQPFIMLVHIIGMAGEARADRLDPTASVMK